MLDIMYLLIHSRDRHLFNITLVLDMVRHNLNMMSEPSEVGQHYAEELFA